MDILGNERNTSDSLSSPQDKDMTTVDPVTELGQSPAGSAGEHGNGRRITRRLALRAAAGAFFFAVIGALGYEAVHYWAVGRFIETTDDAYVQADSTMVSPKVSGYIADLLVDDNQTVKAGQILARIDDRDFRAALDEATANVAAASASVANLDAQIAAQDSVIRQADASVASATAALGLSQRNDLRRRKMAEVGYGSTEQADTASTEATEQAASLERLQAAALTARQQVEVLITQRRLAQAQLAHAEAARRQAELNLSYTDIVAPIDGTVGARTVRVGQYVQAGTQLMALVPLRQVYVVANFKETQLTDVEPGQPVRVRVRVDTFPGDDIVGRVDTLAPASGLEFSLLPPDNATGNFTKIVQRIPVKIVFPPDHALAGRLLPGMSVTASIDARPAAKAEASQASGH
jgi:membrane fusion protein (multidrug efflux system)